MTGKKNTEEEIELTPAEESPWVQFARASVKLDEEQNLHPGFNWFLGFYYLCYKLNRLPNFKLSEILQKLPKEHWLKELNITKFQEMAENNAQKELLPLLNTLLNDLGKPEIIKIIDFSKLSFDKNIDFFYFIFPIDTSFEYSEFFNDANFVMVNFYKNTSFYETKFHEKAFFNDLTSFGNIGFDNAKFYKEAQFSKAILTVVSFTGVQFSKTANFIQATFSQIAEFRRTTFCDLVTFNNANLEGAVSFADAIFQTNAPHFYNAKISENITWDRATWPRIKNDTDRDLIQKNKEVYENLSGHMAKINKHDDQHLFFREEMRCRRKLAESITSGLAFRLYELFSDYGYRIGRAFWCWLGHMILGAIAIFIIALDAGLGLEQARFCSISTSFANANPFVFIGFKEGGLTDCYKVLHYLLPLEFGTIRGIQTLFGIPLLFILLATLRIRFRLK